MASSIDNVDEDIQKIVTEAKRPTRNDESCLDRLSWLLEGPSKCVAVAIIEGGPNTKFCISANEFHENTYSQVKIPGKPYEKEEEEEEEEEWEEIGTEHVAENEGGLWGRSGNQQLNYIIGIMEYFKKIAVKEKGFDENGRISQRDELMRLICKYQINAATTGGIRPPDEIFKAVVSSNILGAYTWALPFDIARMFEKKPDIAHVHVVLGFGLLIFRRIRKIENAIDKANNNNFVDITVEQLQAFKNFAHDYQDKKKSNILFFEPKKGVHAEMQILSRIVSALNKESKNLPQEIYIGISKRCCLDCHCMLEAANSVLVDDGPSLIFENAHDAKFKGWTAPKGFEISKSTRTTRLSEQKQTKLAQDDSLYGKIVIEYHEQKRIIREQKSYGQRHSISDTGASLSPGEKLLVYQRLLEQDFESFKRHQVDCTILLIGLDLCNTQEFKNLFNEAFRHVADVENSLTAMLAQLNDFRNTQGYTENITRDTLLTFLQNKDFAPEEMVELFNKNLDEEEELPSGLKFSMGGQ